MRLDGDLPAIMMDAVRGKLDPATLGQTSQTALGVVITAKGYPGTPEKGSVIGGLDAAAGDGILAGGAQPVESAREPVAVRLGESQRLGGGGHHVADVDHLHVPPDRDRGGRSGADGGEGAGVDRAVDKAQSSTGPSQLGFQPSSGATYFAKDSSTWRL